MYASKGEIDKLPSVTPQLSSELEKTRKNSKKLEKNFGELDCISRADAIQAMQDIAKKITNEDTINGLCGAVAILFDLPSVTPQEPKILALLEKTYADFCNCEGGEGWLKIDGKEYSTDVGYAIEGVDIFMEIFKRRLAESEPQESEGKK